MFVLNLRLYSDFEIATFADSHLTDALKHLASDPNTDKRVNKKLLLVLKSWRDQFKSDPSMTLVAGLYKQCRGDGRPLSQQELTHLIGLPSAAEDKKREKEEAKEKAKREKEEKERRRKERNEESRPTRTPFEFEKVHKLFRMIKNWGVNDRQ